MSFFFSISDGWRRVSGAWTNSSESFSCDRCADGQVKAFKASTIVGNVVSATQHGTNARQLRIGWPNTNASYFPNYCAKYQFVDKSSPTSFTSSVSTIDRRVREKSERKLNVSLVTLKLFTLVHPFFVGSRKTVWPSSVTWRPRTGKLSISSDHPPSYHSIAKRRASSAIAAEESHLGNKSKCYQRRWWWRLFDTKLNAKHHRFNENLSRSCPMQFIWIQRRLSSTSF